jgi:hypothetical protein
LDETKYFDRNQLSKARRRYLQAANRKIVRPLETRIDQSDDPFEIMALDEICDLATNYFQTHPLVLIADSSLRQNRRSPTGLLDSDDIKSRVEIITRMQRLRRQLLN